MNKRIKNILRCYAAGIGIKETAFTFHISRNTVRNIPDLMKDMKRWQLSPIDRRNYERFRKVALGIYRQAGIIDFTTLETTPIKNV